MKANIIFLFALLSFPSSETAAEASDQELLFKFKRPINCESAKKALSRKEIFVNCNKSSPTKKRFFNGKYLGKRSTFAVISELKKESEMNLLSITIYRDPKPIQ